MADKKVFFDVNILQDYLIKRPGYTASIVLVEFVHQEVLAGSVASFSIPILWYINRKDKQPREALLKLLKNFEVISLTPAMVKKTLSQSLFGDLEDELQYLCAKHSKPDYLITRNTRDFPVKDINIVTPEDFLATLR